MGGRSQTASWGIEIDGVTNLKRALRVLAEPDAPFLRSALEESGQLLRAAAARRAPGRIAAAVRFTGVKGKGAGLRATIDVRHPGARSMEFGREMYYRGFTGRQQKATGRKFRVGPGRGQPARPYLGVIKGNAAIAEVEDRVRQLLAEAFEREWERIAVGGGGE